MTKETIIKSTLKYLVKRQIEEGSVGFAVDNDHDHDCCLDDVLAWIEAQSCENAVSRGVLTEYINTKLTSNEEWASDATNEGRWVEEKTYLYGVEILEDLDEYVKTMPPVVPKYTDEEIDKAQAVEQAYVDKMVELAVEETERPKGKWIKCKSRFGTEYFKCSECGRKLNWIDRDDNYCNSCGSDNSESTKEWFKERDIKLAEMSGGGEDEVSD